ncbi:lysozyme inhibitor LprI family protein [Rhizosaccharibacter radicis]|uniref:Lysozyme inhibitor LprI family protein n=1 Tax=Rhizosaccharibacter radicis TaxID=2782605 RepID=A0ABT1VXF3_9PROT|nr:lysozyme inhibitor LprI family protein [Acetobacteraceae bacterium KSS12]
MRLAAAPPHDRAELVQAQRRWLRHRDKDC